MRLLKIGTLNIPRDRWQDALDCFSQIDVFCFDTENEIENEKFRYYRFNTQNKINNFLFRATRHFSYDHNKKVLCNFCLILLRIVNHKLLKKIKSTNYDYIHSSYNDFNESAFLTCLLDPKVYTRAQKETRLYYSFLEKKALENASLIVLNDQYNLELYKRKYGDVFLENKKIRYSLDEDVRSKKLLSVIQYSKKLSDDDGKVHAVILAGRVLSNPEDSRSGGRLYYISLIKSLVQNGIVVHLHTGNIVPYNGHDPYKELEKIETNFIIEGPLDFINDTINAYKVLSRYDIGVCHAHLPNTEVTEFDKVNIPHRYYEYHLAHVVPFDLLGGNLLLEKKASEGYALIVDSYGEITLDKIKNIRWDTTTFSQYIKELYGNDSKGE